MLIPALNFLKALNRAFFIDYGDPGCVLQKNSRQSRKSFQSQRMITNVQNVYKTIRIKNSNYWRYVLLVPVLS